MSRKIFYHFAIFEIVNEILIYENNQIRSVYRQMQAEGEIRP